MREVFNRGMADYQFPGRAEQIRQRALRYNWDKAALGYIGIYRKWNPAEATKIKHLHPAEEIRA